MIKILYKIISKLLIIILKYKKIYIFIKNKNLFDAKNFNCNFKIFDFYSKLILIVKLILIFQII